MKIHHFWAEKLNGYLDFDLFFNSDRNFLIGINGSGKTSVLKAIMALITPDVDWLMNAKFRSVTVDIENEGSLIKISCKAVANGRKLTFSVNGKETSGHIPINEYESMRRTSQEMVYEEDGEYIRMRHSSVASPSHIEVVGNIRSLPTPIFLGLDRSNLPLDRPPLPRQARYSKSQHVTLRAFLDESLGHAEAAVANARSRANVRRQNLASKLRQDMLLTLFSLRRQSGANIPDRRDVQNFEKYRKNLKQAFKILGLETERVESTVDPFFSTLIGAGSALSKRPNLNDLYTGKDQDLDDTFSLWMELSPRLPLLEDVEKLISAFNGKEEILFAKTNLYAEIMNSFLNDSQKELIFREDGSIAIKLPSGSEGVHVLSSGERQLFVLISTLMFGDDTSRSSVLIIDEPELSLHLKWQEMFVDAIARANRDVQIILATHSPSVILDQTFYCVDLQ